MGRPKNPLPERQAKAIESTAYQASEEEVESLKRDFGFNDEYPLADALNIAFMAHESIEYIEHHSVTHRELRDTLAELGKRSAALYEALEKLPPDAHYSLDDQGFSFGRVQSLKTLSNDLQWASHASKKRVQGESRRKPNIPRINFVYKLADIWEEGTSKKASAGTHHIYNPGPNTFYSFVVRCAKIGGITLQDWGDPYYIIQKALKLHKKNRKKLQKKN